MKNIVTVAVLLMATMAGFSFAGGNHQIGTVYYYEDETYQTVTASMNVRYDKVATGAPSIFVFGTAYDQPQSFGEVTVRARDKNGKFFSCYVLPSSILFPKALALKNGFRNGSTLRVTKQKDNNQCVTIEFRQDSTFLD